MGWKSGRRGRPWYMETLYVKTALDSGLLPSSPFLSCLRRQWVLVPSCAEKCSPGLGRGACGPGLPCFDLSRVAQGVGRRRPNEKESHWTNRWWSQSVDRQWTSEGVGGQDHFEGSKELVDNGPETFKELEGGRSKQGC